MPVGLLGIAGAAIMATLLCACAAATALAAAPAVTGVAPDFGAAAGGTVVTLQGSGFQAGATTVSFGGVAAGGVEVTGDDSLTAVSPPGSGTVDVTVEDADGESAPVSHDWFAYEPAPDGFWLGLNDNSVSNVFTGEWLGPVDEFSRQGIVYDRSFELTAGESPDETESDSKGGTYFEDRLALDHEYGMIPVGPIEFKGYTGRLIPDPAFPQEQRTAQEEAEGKTTIAQYVHGFVQSASDVLRIVSRRYPGMPVLLEAMNEPWGYTTPRYNGAEYAKVIAQLLPAARAAGIPLSDIYISAFGADQYINAQGEPEYSPSGWVPAMYAAEPSLTSEIQGWYLHPYGFPSGTEFDDSWGIQSVPAVREQMQSGRDNIIVSEDGYCARSEGGDCDGTGGSEVETREEAAERLTAMLEDARPYREAGWLKALIVYARDDGGWSMLEYPSKQPSKQGEALVAFALAHGFTEPPEEQPCESDSSLFMPLGSRAPEAPLAPAAVGPACPGEGDDDQQLAVTSEGQNGPSLSADLGPPPGSPAGSSSTPAARVTLTESFVRVRDQVARVTLGCVGVGDCAGRVGLAIEVASRRGGHRVVRDVRIGHASFVLAASHVRQIRVTLSELGQRLLVPLARGTRVNATLSIAQSSPRVYPPVNRAVRLVP